jgi:hypothetical protein
MKKTILILLTATLFIPISHPTAAGLNGKTVVIIDYTFFSGAAELKDSVLADLCFSITRSCTVVPSNRLYGSDSLTHGTTMALVAKKVDPSMKFILIRVGSINPKTYALSKMSSTEFDNVLIPAMDWVAQNAAKYNIAAVSTSMSHNSFSTSGSYCPIRKSSSYPGTLQERIIKLQNLGVASVFSAGNTYDNLRVSYPACIKESFAIGATEEREGTVNPASLKSAKGPDVDFYALGTYQLSFARMTGQTSPAAAAFATYWTKQYQKDFQSTLNFVNNARSDVYFGLTKTSARQFIDVFK